MRRMKFISISLLVVLSTSLPLVYLPNRVVLGSSDFSFSQIEAAIQVLSPKDNYSYTGNISLNLSVEYYALSRTPNSGLIPYQNICCLYQLDNSEWKNTSMYYASNQGGFWDPPNNGYWNAITCNYSAALPALMNGLHSINITVSPSILYYYRTNVNNVVLSSTVDFYVTCSNGKLAATTNSANSNSTLYVIIVILVAIGVAVLAYWKKRKR